MASDASRLEYSRSWRFNASNASVGIHPLGLSIYSMPIEPFDSAEGDLYIAEVRFVAHTAFAGVASQAGGGGGGACQGSSSLWYGGSRAAPFLGDGGGGGNGGRPGEALYWEFNVDSRHAFEAGQQAEEAGLASASYEAPSERQCRRSACASPGEVTGLCERVCRNESAAALTALSWQPSTTSDNKKSAGTLCMYENTNPFDEAFVTLDVNLTLIYHFHPLPERSPSAPPPVPPPIPTAPPTPPTAPPATPPALPPHVPAGWPRMPPPQPRRPPPPGTPPPPCPPLSPPVLPPLVTPPSRPRPIAPPASPPPPTGEGAFAASNLPAVALAIVLVALGLLGAVICYCRFGRRNKRALKRALQPKQLVELPQMVVGSGGDAGKPGNSTLAETLD